MSQAYIGEVRLVGFNFPPVGWAQCAGQLIAISENSALFNLIGTTYGGNGQTNFGLPNLQGRIPIHQGSNGTTNYVYGQMGGAETVTIGIGQYPMHNHLLYGSSSSGGANSPIDNVVAAVQDAYSGPPLGAAMNTGVLAMSGGGNQAHENRQPYLAINWIISLYGIYPTPS